MLRIIILQISRSRKERKLLRFRHCHFLYRISLFYATKVRPNSKLCSNFAYNFSELKMKKLLLFVFFLSFSLLTQAQESRATYTLLRLPASAHAAALGGENISLIDDVPSLGYSNPALYSTAPNKSVGFMFSTLPAAGNLMGFQAARAFGARHTVGVAAQLINYGKVNETDASGNERGDFTPSDFVLSAGYSYLLTDLLAGGANLKMISSKYGQYSAVALAVDLGLNYYDEEKDLSVSLTLSNMGNQIKTFHEGEKDAFPLNLQMGMTRGLNHLPLRLSLTLTDLTRWDDKYYFKEEDTSLSFVRKALNHVVLGLDVVPADFCYLALGYNFRRAYELKQAGSSHFAGFTLGAGLRLERFKLGLAYGRYSLGASSLMGNVAFVL